MNPKQAIKQLRRIGWTCIQIAKVVGMHRSSVYRILDDKQPRLSYAVASKLIDMAEQGRKPPRT